MIKRFFSGFVTMFPFISLGKRSIMFFPEEVFKNDWRVIGNDIGRILRQKINQNKKVEDNE